jgi:hypothetical protein
MWLRGVGHLKHPMALSEISPETYQPVAMWAGRTTKLALKEVTFWTLFLSNLAFQEKCAHIHNELSE